MPLSATLEFIGAAQQVTGSCHLLEVNGRRVLLDCGLIQGSRKDEARNSDPFPFDAKEVAAVVLENGAEVEGDAFIVVVGDVFAHDHCRLAEREETFLLRRDCHALIGVDLQISPGEFARFLLAVGRDDEAKAFLREAAEKGPGGSEGD